MDADRARTQQLELGTSLSKNGIKAALKERQPVLFRHLEKIGPGAVNAIFIDVNRLLTQLMRERAVRSDDEIINILETTAVRVAKEKGYILAA